MSGPTALDVSDAIDTAVLSLEFAKKVYGSAKDVQSLPSAFQDVAKLVQVACDALKTAKEQIEQREDDRACGEMEPVAAECRGTASLLKQIYRAVVMSDSSQRMERYRKAVREMENGDRVEKLMQSILEDAHLLLTVDDEMKAAAESQLGKLVEAMKEVSAIPPSLPEESPASGINNFGPGTLIANTGSGKQYNNTGSGQQFNGNVHNVNNAAESRNAVG